MTGIICMWHGQIVDIPNGWALCDGTNGTPNLLQKFVLGNFPGLNPGRTGGGSAHIHGGLAEEESDWLDDGEEVSQYDEELNLAQSTIGHGHFLDIDPASNMPPYYEVAFIMKL